MSIYIITFLTFGSNEYQVYSDVFALRKDAEIAAKDLRACGHKQVTISKREIRF